MSEIILVEPNAEVAALMVLTLQQEGYQVIPVASAEAALEKIAPSSTALVITEVGLPGMNGYQFTLTLNQKYGLDTIPLFFVTAHHETHEIVQGLEVAAEYLIKPFAVPEFLARLRRILRLYAHRNAEESEGAVNQA